MSINRHGDFSVNHYDWRKCDRVDDEQVQGDQRERCNRIKSKQLTPKKKIVTFIQKLNWRKGDRVDDEQHKIIPFYKIVSVALLNLHSRSKANPYVYKNIPRRKTMKNKLTVQEMILTLQNFGHLMAVC